MNQDQIELVTIAAQHALQMRRSIGAPDVPVIAATGSKERMLAALTAAELDTLITFSMIPADEVESRPVCGTWTLRELAGHLADWDKLFCYWLGLLRGNPPQAIYWDEDGDAFNAYLQAQREGESWESAWGDFRRSRAVLYETLAAVPEDEFMRVQPPSEYVSYPTIYHCAWSALEHYLDHASGVRRELGLSLPPQLLHFQGPYT